MVASPLVVGASPKRTAATERDGFSDQFRPRQWSLGLRTTNADSQTLYLVRYGCQADVVNKRELGVYERRLRRDYTVRRAR